MNYSTITDWKNGETVYHASNPDVPAQIIALKPRNAPEHLKLNFKERVSMPGNLLRGSDWTWVCSKCFTYRSSEEARAVHEEYVIDRTKRSEELDGFKAHEELERSWVHYTGCTVESDGYKRSDKIEEITCPACAKAARAAHE